MSERKISNDREIEQAQQAIRAIRERIEAQKMENKDDENKVHLTEIEDSNIDPQENYFIPFEKIPLS